jgi:hypothetical protein
MSWRIGDQDEGEQLQVSRLMMTAPQVQEF